MRNALSYVREVPKLSAFINESETDVLAHMDRSFEVDGFQVGRSDQRRFRVSRILFLLAGSLASLATSPIRQSGLTFQHFHSLILSTSSCVSRSCVRS
jgi:hypothetical protein